MTSVKKEKKYSWHQNLECDVSFVILNEETSDTLSLPDFVKLSWEQHMNLSESWTYISSIDSQFYFLE